MPRICLGLVGSDTLSGFIAGLGCLSSSLSGLIACLVRESLGRSRHRKPHLRGDNHVNRERPECSLGMQIARAVYRKVGLAALWRLRSTLSLTFSESVDEREMVAELRVFPTFVR